MTFRQLEGRINRNVAKIVKETAQEFYADIVLAWPVDTGDSRKEWKKEKIDRHTWTVSNAISYAPVLFLGRIGTKGSDQMPDGGHPILKTNRIKMKRRLKKDTL